jgi:hypothetical protein
MLIRFFTVLRDRTGAAVLLVSIAAAGACSDDGDESSNTGGSPSATGGTDAQGGSTGGSSMGGRGATGGSATGGVAAPSGGSADTGGRGGVSAGGAGMKGGATSTGGKGPDIDAGEPCTEDCPGGTVQACFEECPLGSCDNAGLFGDVPCSMLYPGEIDADTVYCRAGQTSNYCFTTIDRILKYYEIYCDDGTPTVTLCDGGCGVDPDGVAACN